MAPTVEDFITGFPHPIVPKIEGLPTYESVAELQRLHNANAASVHTTLGGGALGYLALTVLVAVYATHSNVAFVAPVNPGPLPAIGFGAIAAVLAEQVRQFNEAKRLWQEYQMVGKALKQQLLGAVDDIYL